MLSYLKLPKLLKFTQVSLIYFSLPELISSYLNYLYFLQVTPSYLHYLMLPKISTQLNVPQIIQNSQIKWLSQVALIYLR
jgi:hypothetical protein